MGLLAQKNERGDDDASEFSGTATATVQNIMKSRSKMRPESWNTREEALVNHWIQPLPLHQRDAQRNDLDVQPR